MNKPLHPTGDHKLRLISAKFSRGCVLRVQCIFEGVGENQSCQTISRIISKHSPWADTSRPFFKQLCGFGREESLESELQRYLGQEFHCRIKEGSGWQRNITAFLETPPNINSTTHVDDPSLTGESHVG